MSMAIKYGLMKRAKKSGACDAHGAQGCEMCMAEGGMVDEEASGYPPMPEAEPKENEAAVEDDDIVDRIMKRFAKGGMVEGEPVADFKDNDFDVMDEMDPGTKADYTGANSGDELGDEQEDMDRRDIVARIMRSRSKKDRMPRPA